MQDSDEEIVAEEDVEMGPAALKRLRERLAVCVKEKQDYLEGWQRARADFSNLKREESRRETEQETRVKIELTEAILPTLDSFEMALKMKLLADAPKELKDGINGLYKQLVGSLQKIGVEQFDNSAAGQKFDPQKHEALRESTVASEAADHTITEVFRSGYRVGEKIIRPAQVAVGIFKKS